MDDPLSASLSEVELAEETPATRRPLSTYSACDLAISTGTWPTNLQDHLSPAWESFRPFQYL
jgi:hypothetical protein